MNLSKKRFFIAILPPKNIQKKATEIKQYFKEFYDSKAALKSPPHITLQPPFEWHLEQLPILLKELENFSNSQTPFDISLMGFAAFKPRVIFINVIKTPTLLSIQKQLMSHLESSLNIVHEVEKNRSFSPHLTVAFRDLTKPNFYKAWSEFQEKDIYFNFSINQLTLLIHNGQRWEIHTEFSFNKSMVD